MPVVPPLSRVSSTNAPSRMEISRSAVAAMRASWVTMTSVWPGLVQLLEEPQHVERRGTVQVAGRLVGEHDQRLVAQRAGDRDPLALTTGQRGRQEAGPVGEPDPLQQLLGAAAGPPAGERPASSAGSSTFSTAVSSSIRWKAWKTKPTSVAPHPGQRPLADVVDAPTGQPDLAGRWAGPARRAGAAASTCRSRWAPSPPPSRPARRRDRPRRRRAPALPPAVRPFAARGRCSDRRPCRPLLIVHSLRCVQLRSHASSQRRSACSRSTMPSSSSAAVRAVRLGHRGALGVAQPAQQLAALGVDDGQRVGQPGRRGSDQLEVELREVGLGPAHLGQPLGDPLLAGRRSARRPCDPAGPAPVGPRSSSTRPAFSSRASVT